MTFVRILTTSKKGFRCVGCPAADTRPWIEEGFATMKEAGRNAAYCWHRFQCIFFDVCPLIRDDRRMVLTQNKACKQSRISIVALNLHDQQCVYNGWLWDSHVWKVSSNFNQEITCTIELITRVPWNNSCAGSHQILHANLELETLLETGGHSEKHHCSEFIPKSTRKIGVELISFSFLIFFL